MGGEHGDRAWPLVFLAKREHSVAINQLDSEQHYQRKSYPTMSNDVQEVEHTPRNSVSSHAQRPQHSELPDLRGQVPQVVVGQPQLCQKRQMPHLKT